MGTTGQSLQLSSGSGPSYPLSGAAEAEIMSRLGLSRLTRAATLHAGGTEVPVSIPAVYDLAYQFGCFPAGGVEKWVEVLRVALPDVAARLTEQQLCASAAELAHLGEQHRFAERPPAAPRPVRSNRAAAPPRYADYEYRSYSQPQPQQAASRDIRRPEVRSPPKRWASFELGDEDEDLLAAMAAEAEAGQATAGVTEAAAAPLRAVAGPSMAAAGAAGAVPPGAAGDSMADAAAAAPPGAAVGRTAGQAPTALAGSGAAGAAAQPAFAAGGAAAAAPSADLTSAATSTRGGRAGRNRGGRGAGGGRSSRPGTAGLYDPAGDTLVTRFPGLLEQIPVLGETQLRSLLQLLYSYASTVEVDRDDLWRTVDHISKTLCEFETRSMNIVDNLQMEMTTVRMLMQQLQRGRPRGGGGSGRNGTGMLAGMLASGRAAASEPSISGAGSGGASGGDAGELGVELGSPPPAHNRISMEVYRRAGCCFLGGGGTPSTQVFCFVLECEGSATVFDDNGNAIAAGQYVLLMELVDLYGPTAETRQSVGTWFANKTNPGRGGQVAPHIKLSMARLREAGVEDAVFRLRRSTHGYKLVSLDQAEEMILEKKSNNGTALGPDDQGLFKEDGPLCWVADGDIVPQDEWM